MTDDINSMAAAIREQTRQNEIQQTAEDAAARKRIAAANIAEQRRLAEVDQLCKQLARWAKANHVKPSIRFGHHRGWTLASRTSWYGTDEMWSRTRTLAIDTAGRLYSLKHDRTILSSHRRWSGPRVRSHGFTVGDVQAGIAKIVAESGKPW